jgi:hypothetical protein
VRAEPAGDTDEAAASALAARRALVVVRILAYDKALATRVHDGVLIVAVVARPTAAGQAEQARWLDGFRQLPKVRAGGHGLRVVQLALDTPARFAAAVARLHPAALILPPGLGAARSAVSAASRATAALTFTSDEADVRAGLAIGVVPGVDRDAIAINLEAARAEGARLGAGLLQLARLVDEDAP